MRLVMTAALVVGSLAAPGLLTRASEAADPPVHDVVVRAMPGASLTTYPAFDASVDRFSVRSAADIDQLSVTASSSDPDAAITVNGRPAVNGEPYEVVDLEAGDEVNVQIADAAGTSNQSWIVLPARFPEVRATGPDLDLAEGRVFVTLASFLAPPFSAVLDDRGVPSMVFTQNGSDFKQSAADPDHYSIALPVDSGGHRIVELDAQYRELDSHRLAGTAAGSTDFHDSTLFADGSALLMGYDHLSRDGGVWTDAIIERVDPEGAATWTWNSKDHVDETEGLVDRTAHDYAHINAMQELDDGDVLASFRNLSQVMRIAGSDHDGFVSGDVIWRLGGLRNDFVFVNDPYGGPCAQHAAQILPNGHLLIFDNGSRRDDGGPIAPQTADMCPDPSDPDGPRVARPQSRVTEYALDPTTSPPTATLVWSHAPTGRYAPFAGNAQRLPNGNTMVGWSQSEAASGLAPVATEVTPAGEEIWSLTADGHFSYRAFRYPAPDRITPEVTITTPVDGTTVEQGAPLVASFGCTDTGGANLDRCSGTVANGGSLAGQLGTHELVVSATDRNGNTASRTVTYTVIPRAQLPTTPTPTTGPSPATTPAAAARADAQIRRRGGRWKGRGVIGGSRQTVTVRAARGRTTTAEIRVRNAGNAAGRIALSASQLRSQARGQWYVGRREITSQLRDGTWRTPRLSPGESIRLRVIATMRAGASARPTVLTLVASARGTDRDIVRARVRLR